MGNAPTRGWRLSRRVKDAYDPEESPNRLTAKASK
jgi:hypothetical protein